MSKFKDISGMVFDRLTVVSLSHMGNAENRYKSSWNCRCVCGTEKVVSLDMLKNTRRKVKSCGCFSKQKKINHTNYNAKDLIGQRYGRLLVLRKIEKPVHLKGRNHYWECKCDCGKITRLSTHGLTKTRSCGCLQKEAITKPEGVSRINRIFNTYERSAKKRKLAFELTHEEVDKLVKSNCNYCDAPPVIKVYNGIDRVDNTQGYLKDNSVPCCVTCNRMKQSLSVKDFFGHMRKILEKYGEI